MCNSHVIFLSGDNGGSARLVDWPILGTQMNEKIIAFVLELVTQVIMPAGTRASWHSIDMQFRGIPHSIRDHHALLGYLVYLGRFNLVFVAAAGAVGCNIGSAVAYRIGARGGRPLVERYGNWVLMSHRDLDLMSRFFDKYGSIAILVGRMTADRADLCGLPGGDRQNAAPAFSYLYFCGFLDLVFLSGLGGHEAWPGMAHRSAIRAGVSPLSCRR